LVSSDKSRGNWNSKLGFILAAAGSAVGLGNIWGFPSQVADNGGAAFLVVYLLCCLAIGLPVMIAELAVGRYSKRNPVGALRAISTGWFPPLIGFWGVICGVMILSFYLVVAGWTAGYVFEEIFFFAGLKDTASWFGALDNGPKNALFSVLFMLATIFIVTGGVSNGIEKATKLLMPLLIFILGIMIVYVLTLEGSMEGVRVYLQPDFSDISADLVFSAMGQAFFSLSLGMGALITYGSYLSKKQNLVESATYVTLADVGIAFMAGFLIIPAMFVAQAGGVEILDADGNLVASTTLVFNVLPQMFHNMGALGLLAGVMFFVLLGMAALTSTISLLEVPVAYMIDEHQFSRKKAAWAVGTVIMAFAVVVSFHLVLIDILIVIFNNIGLPLGGLMICIVVGYFWKSEEALEEISHGFEGVKSSWFAPVWTFFIKVICPVIIGLVFITTVYNLIN
jgi:neurotransmitter:Na+ symporter, NSS family